MQPLEDTEKFSRAGLVEAGPVVAHAVFYHAAPRGRADAHRRGRGAGSELHGVGEEVQPQLPEHGPVPAGRRQGAELESARPARRDYLVPGRQRERPHVRRAQRQFFARQPGEREQILYQLPHLYRITPYHSGHPAAFSVQPGAVILLEYARKTLYRPQRGPQVVGNRIGESLQFLVGLLQLRGARRHARFQRAVELAQAFLGGLAHPGLGAQQDIEQDGAGGDVGPALVGLQGGLPRRVGNREIEEPVAEKYPQRAESQVGGRHAHLRPGRQQG